MKILLTAINSKYIHSNLAVYALKAYALKQATPEDVEIEIAEYTINQQLETGCTLPVLLYLESFICRAAGRRNKEIKKGHTYMGRRSGSIVRFGRCSEKASVGYRGDERRRRRNLCRINTSVRREKGG